MLRIHSSCRYALWMLRMTVLASGSRGNSVLLSSTESDTQILVDAGLSCRELVKRMRFMGEAPEKLSAIVVTHEHQDHVQGVGVLSRKFNVPVYFTRPTHDAWKRWVSPKAKRISREQWFLQQRERAGAAAEPPAASPYAPAWQHAPDAVAAAAAAVAPAPEFVCAMQEARAYVAQPEPEEFETIDPTELAGVEYFEAGKPFCIRDIGVMPFTIPHDATDPVGFVMTVSGVRVGLVTDLGYMPPNVSLQLRRCDVLYIESNHDLEMLRTGPYPWSVKQRVLSRVGHLSNDGLAQFFDTEYDGSAAVVVLAHLSESNNHPEIARECAERALGDRTTLLANRLLVAKQCEPLEPILL